MAALKAVIIALSLLGVVILYSDIVEDEEISIQDESEIDQSQASNPSTGTGSENFLFGQLLTAESGSFQSPNFPVTDHKLDYLWLIKVAKTKTIRLVMVDFDTEPNFDYVFVHDGDSTEHPVILIHSGNSTPPPIRSTRSEMLVRFVTNNKVTSRGFQANYFTVPPCFNAIYSSSGLITSSGYPSSYDNNMHCDWLISVGQSEKILFEFFDVNTEEDYDVIQVYDGDSDFAPFLNRISGDHRDEVMFLTATSNTALIRFTTDKSISKTGFAIKFTAGNHADLIRYFMAEYPDYLKDSDLIKKAFEEDVSESTMQVMAHAVPAIQQDVVKVSNVTTTEY